MSAAPAAPNWTLRRRLAQLTAGLTVVILLLVAIIAVSASRFVLAGNQVINRWDPARLVSEQLLNDLVDQETATRAYEITHDPTSLVNYHSALPEQRADTRRVLDLVGDDTSIRRLVAVVEKRADAWHAGYVRPLLQAVEQGRSTASIDADAGHVLFTRIRSAVVPLDDAVEARGRSAERDRTLTGIVSVVAISIGLVLVIALSLYLRRALAVWVLRPVRELATQTRVVAGGELDTQIDVRGPLELVRLGEDVDAMRAQLVIDLADAERITENLRRQGAELERSNADLQQFAYVASHDLSEPLRKVSNFCQLLERQYGDQLDDRARQYIGFAVDGAKRMQALINDLLSLSRVGRATDSFVPVDLDRALDQALLTLADPIAAAGGEVLRESALPTIPGDRALLVSLLENLVGNAVKYHRDDVAPVVRIAATPLPRAGSDGPGGWTIRVSDNGIGIDAQYAERIFAVFQRLHLRDQYGGTGIGLALCRRIVEFHGGRIALDTASRGPLDGATFVIDFPEGGPRGEHPS